MNNSNHVNLDGQMNSSANIILTKCKVKLISNTCNTKTNHIFLLCYSYKVLKTVLRNKYDTEGFLYQDKQYIVILPHAGP